VADRRARRRGAVAVPRPGLGRPGRRRSPGRRCRGRRTRGRRAGPVIRRRPCARGAAPDGLRHRAGPPLIVIVFGAPWGRAAHALGGPVARTAPRTGRTSNGSPPWRRCGPAPSAIPGPASRRGSGSPPGSPGRPGGVGESGAGAGPARRSDRCGGSPRRRVDGSRRSTRTPGAPAGPAGHRPARRRPRSPWNRRPHPVRRVRRPCDLHCGDRRCGDLHRARRDGRMDGRCGRPTPARERRRRPGRRFGRRRPETDQRKECALVRLVSMMHNGARGHRPGISEAVGEGEPR